MPSFRRILLGLPLAAAAASLWSLPLAAQGRAVEGGAVPLLRGVARMSCGAARPWKLGLPRRAVTGPGSLAAQPVTLDQAELLGTLELRFGGGPRRGIADAERRSGSWSVTQVGHCTGGRGPLRMALLTPAAEGRPARFELRGPASHIRRPGALRATAEGGEVRFTGTCGRRQEVVMEIWPPAGLGVPRQPVEPERYRLVGTVTCAGAAAVAVPGAAAPAPAR